MIGLKAFLDCLKEDILKKSSNSLTCILNVSLSTLVPASLPMQLTSVKTLNGTNYEDWKKVPYASAVGSLMYAQVCTRPDIAFVVNALGRYLSNPGLNNWKVVTKVMRYL